MTSTLCQSAALERIFAPWTAKIAVFFHIIVRTILTIAEIIRTTLHESGACCRKPGQRLLALRPRLSWPRIIDNRKVDLEVSMSRADARSLASLVAAIVAGPESREEQPAEANGDDAKGSSRISKSLRVTIQEASGRPVLT